MIKPSKKDYIHVLRNTAQGQRKLQAWVSDNIGTNQTYLIDELFQNQALSTDFSFDNITNTYLQFEEVGSGVCQNCQENTEINEQGFCVECWEDGEYKYDYEQEIFEWWIVDTWVAKKLEDRGEPILNNDCGIWWGRTTTGQAIAMDYVIADIVADLWLEYWEEDDQKEYEEMKEERK